MAKGKHKGKKKNSQKIQSVNKNVTNASKKQYVKQQSKNSAKKSNASKKATASNSYSPRKFKLQVMDVITIIFTAIIIGIMIVVVYNQFAESSGSGNKGGNNSALNSSAPSASATATAAPATAKPLSDIGNIYGNITNEASVVTINEREYFISDDDEGISHIYVKVGNTTKEIIEANASSLNVVEDTITYFDQKDVTGYYIFYINGDGDICYIKEGPVGTQLDSKEELKETVLLEGNYKSIDVSAEYVYHIDKDGVIGKTNIHDKKTTILSYDRAYSDFVFFFGKIYAKGLDDGFIYTLSNEVTTTSTSASNKETEFISVDCDSFVLDNSETSASDWIYVVSDNKLSRYSINSSNSKETLLEKDIDCINVYKDNIYYISNGRLYKTTPMDCTLGNEPIRICKTASEIINVGTNAIYLLDEDNKLCKITYDTNTKEYSEPIEMI